MTRILGISDDVTVCECCGKSNLKRTVVLDLDGAIVHYGCDCARKAFRSRSVRTLDRKGIEKLATVAAHYAAHGEESTWQRFGWSVSAASFELQRVA